MIWIIGGTSDANELATRLMGLDVPVLVSVATDYGAQLAQSLNLSIVSGKMDLLEMEEFAKKRNIHAIIDASHPYAVQVSKNAREIAYLLQLPIIRYERRPSMPEHAVLLENHEAAVAKLSETTGNILITTGSNNAGLYAPLGKRAYLRVLSTADSVAIAQKAGFDPAQIIAMKGTFSVEFTATLLREFDIKHLVTKDSGAEGGVPEKAEAARIVGATLWLIQRPQTDSHNVCSTIDELLAWLKAAYLA